MQLFQNVETAVVTEGFLIMMTGTDPNVQSVSIFFFPFIRIPYQLTEKKTNKIVPASRNTDQHPIPEKICRTNFLFEKSDYEGSQKKLFFCVLGNCILGLCSRTGKHCLLQLLHLCRE